MKKWLLTLLVLLAVLTASAACADTTLMMYMCGSDLQSDCLTDLKEMCAAASSRDVNIVVLAGGASKWNDKRLKADRLNLFTIEGGSFSQVTDWGRDNMGSANTLTKFVSYASKQYPADRMILVMWNHGGGSYDGVCYDESNDYDSLSLLEIGSAMEQLQRQIPSFHLNIVGMDACLMACYEAAVLFAPYADYMVASEELEPGSGWYYTDWLNALARDPGMNDEKLCSEIVSAYKKAGEKADPDDYLTLSAIRLGKIEPLRQAVEALSGDLSEALEHGELKTINRMHQRMNRFGSFAGDSTDMVDLGAVLDLCAQFSPERTQIARCALADAVAVSYASANVPGAVGLSIFLPKSERTNISKILSNYGVNDQIPRYVDFIQGYAAMMNGSSYVFTGSATQTATVAEASTSWLNIDTAMMGLIPAPSFIAGSASGQTGAAATTAPGQSGVPGFIPGTVGGQTDAAATAAPVQSGIPGFIPGSVSTTAVTTPTITDDAQAFSMSLTAEEMEYLSYVEGMLLMDLSDDEYWMALELGYMQNSWIDWQNDRVCTIFDCTWPSLDGQLVVMYDQTRTERIRRSLIPVKVNGEETFLVVVFEGDSRVGRIAGHNEGFDDNGLPVRGTKPLREGDVIVPLYTMYYNLWDADDEETMEETIEGDPIVWRSGMTVTYESLRFENDPTTYQFSFALNDIFGDYEVTDPIEFTI